MAQTSPQTREQAVKALNRVFIVCHVCDALWLRPDLAANARAVCSRCNTTLLNEKSRSIQRTVALTLAGLILYLVAVSFPFIHLERAGLSNKMSVIDAVRVLWTNDMFLLSVATALFILVFPLLQLVVFFSLGVLLMYRVSLSYFHAFALRFTYQIAPWSMAEIFMVGVIVSLVKVGELADVELGPAFWAMASLNLVLLLTTAVNTRDSLWRQIRQIR